MSLLKSKGVKRLGASALLAAAGVAYFIPGLGSASSYLAQAGAGLGAVGVGHAALAGSVDLAKLATLASFLAVLAEAMKYIPSAAPYAEYVKYLAELLGALALGNAVVNK